MSRRCKPGQRARVVRGWNAGKVVVVVRHYFGEPINDAVWPRAFLPWVVTSVGGPLRSKYLDTGKEAPPAMTIVLDDPDLEPLRDDDEGDDAMTHEPKAKPKVQARDSAPREPV